MPSSGLIAAARRAASQHASSATPEARRRPTRVDTRRFDVAKNRYLIGRIDIGDRYIAQSEKDAALLRYVEALRSYWLAYYRLRRLTLYDFEALSPLAP